MVDSVKNYGITGVGATVELGKKGPKIDGSSTDKISLRSSAGALITAEVANGELAAHSVTLAQLEATSENAVGTDAFTVNYDSGNVSLATFAAGTSILRVTVEKGAGNWTGADSSTEITVGDADNVSKYFSGFDVTAQVAEEGDHTLATDTELFAYVTPGGASSGSAKISIFYAGSIR